jgi:hypothetical protein
LLDGVQGSLLLLPVPGHQVIDELVNLHGCARNIGLSFELSQSSLQEFLCDAVISRATTACPVDKISTGSAALLVIAVQMS